MGSKPIRSYVTRQKHLFLRILCHRKFMRMGEYFMRKWRHVPCVMTSFTILPMSVLNIWIRRGLTALLVLVNVLSDLFHFWFVFQLLLYSTVCYFSGSGCIVLAFRSPCWVKEHPTVVFKDHKSGERFGRFGSFSTESCILNCEVVVGGGGGQLLEGGI